MLGNVDKLRSKNDQRIVVEQIPHRIYSNNTNWAQIEDIIQITNWIGLQNKIMSKYVLWTVIISKIQKIIPLVQIIRENLL